MLIRKMWKKETTESVEQPRDGTVNHIISQFRKLVQTSHD